MSPRRPIGARRLNLAMRCWSRRDRRGAGDVAYDTALDLIEFGGSSPDREALALARAGLVLRGRSVARALTSPLAASALPVAIAGLTGLVAIFVVTDAGGWHALTADLDGSGLTAPLLLLASVAVAVSAIGRWVWLTVALQLALAFLVAQWWIEAPRLGDASIVFSPGGDYLHASDLVFVDVPISAIVALQLGFGLLYALTAAVAHATNRGQRPPRSLGASFTGLGLWLVVVGAGPRVGHDLATQLAAVPHLRPEFFTGAASVLLVVGATLVVLLVAITGSRAQPALATGAVLIGAPLWLPCLLVVSPFAYSPAAAPLAETDGLLASLAIWGGATLAALWLAARIVRRAAASHATRAALASAEDTGDVPSRPASA